MGSCAGLGGKDGCARGGALDVVRDLDVVRIKDGNDSEINWERAGLHN